MSAEHAIKLLGAYAALLPGACSDLAGGSDIRPHEGELPTHGKQVLATGRSEAVRQMVVALSQLACRSLDSHSPLELVRLVSSLPRLGAQLEASAVLPRVTPRLLRGETLER